MSEAPSQPTFEVGPIRPPSEASSLLLRVSRNCPWNRCTFCPVYKCERFSLRSLDEILGDIDGLAAAAERVRQAAGGGNEVTVVGSALVRELVFTDPTALPVAVFLAAGGRSAFLQDADSLVLPPGQLVRVLAHLRAAFPSLQRITTYARARTLVRRSVDELRALREAGLNRIHVGLESGDDEVLRIVDKGVTAEQQIEAGKRVNAAGMELSLYVMPGLGGRKLSAQHARETARVLCEIDPAFVRLRSLAVAPGTPLAEARERGEFEPLDDLEMVVEIRALVAGLEGIHSRLVSDHVLNLLGELDGKLPDDRPALLAQLDTFLALDAEQQQLFTIGRRLGLLQRPLDLFDEQLAARVRAARERLATTYGGDLDRAIDELRRRFI